MTESILIAVVFFLLGIIVGLKLVRLAIRRAIREIDRAS
jgi:hypothetical protein